MGAGPSVCSALSLSIGSHSPILADAKFSLALRALLAGLIWADGHEATAATVAITATANRHSAACLTSATATAFINRFWQHPLTRGLAFTYPVGFEILVIDGAVCRVADLIGGSGCPCKERYVVHGCA
ncbi:hypothetical protein C1930_10575 [Stenotrophomonas sp. SAU14A_NAIMI4_8]|nr:hypothetical protein C1930_10575 [Stenotrophomonas sp. SAU14A_NAIMI4_8]